MSETLTISQPVGDDPLTSRMGGGGPMAEHDLCSDSVEYWQRQARPETPRPRHTSWTLQRLIIRAQVARAIRGGIDPDAIYDVVAEAVEEFTPTTLMEVA